MKTIISQYIFSVLARISTVFFLYFLCRILFFVINLSFFESVQISTFLWYCWVGLKFDLTAILYINILFLLLSYVPFRFRTNKKYLSFLFYLFIITNSIGIILNTVDFGYFPFILQRSTFVLFDFIQTEGNIWGLVPTLAFEFWYVPILSFLLIFLFWFLNKKISSTTDIFPASSIKFYAFSTILFIALIPLMLIGIRGGIGKMVRPIGILQAGNYVNKPIETALVLNTPFSIIRTITRGKLEKFHFYTKEELISIYSPYHLPKNTPPKQENVVILILESFSKEYSGYLNPDLDSGIYMGYMPFLDSLMQESLVYTNCYANGRKSLVAMPSVIASIPSFKVDYPSSLYGNNTINSLPNLLKEKGYTSAFFHGAENGSMNFNAFSKLAGFNKYYGRDEYLKENNPFIGNIWGIHDEPFYQYFAQKMNALPEPFITTFFSLSSHSPFVVPEPYNGKFKEGPLEIHKMIGYADFSLRNFFETAQKMPWFDNTLFVITADHCSLPHYENYKGSAQLYAIPLIFYKKNSSFKGLDSLFAQQLDIMPTVLHYLGYDKPYIAFGTDLLDSTNNLHFSINYFYGNYQFIKDSYLLQYDLEKVVGLYDIKNDVLQKNNLKGKLPEIENEMLSFLKAFLQQYRNRLVENKFTNE